MIPFEAPWGNYLLKDFIEIPPPPMVDWLPKTSGWLLVGLVLLFLILQKTYKAIKLYQSNAYRRDAITWLEALPEYTNLLQQPIFRSIPTLLRKVAVTGHGREHVVTLASNEWEQWLDQQCSKTAFSGKLASHLQHLSYSAESELTVLQMSELIEHVTLWVNFHRSQDD